MARTITITTTKRARERQKIEMEKQVHFGHCAYAALTGIGIKYAKLFIRLSCK